MPGASPPDTRRPDTTRATSSRGDTICGPRRPWFHVVFVVLTLVSAVLMCWLVVQRPGWIDSPLVDQPAPVVSGTDTLGRAVTTADSAGRVVIVGFAAMDCKPSLDAMSAWQSIRDALGDAPRVRVVAFCLNDPKNEVGRFIQQRGIRYGVVVGPSASAIEAYQVEGIPRTVIIRPDGTVARVYDGYHPDMVALVSAAIRARVSGSDRVSEQGRVR